MTPIPWLTLSTAPPGSVMITAPNTVTEGHAFQLTCAANGWPPPTYDVMNVFVCCVLCVKSCTVFCFCCVWGGLEEGLATTFYVEHIF